MNIFQEYDNLDYEDIIAGELKTKYQYIETKEEDFGLNDMELLFADEKILNMMISIKKLAPYRENAIT